VPDAEPGPLSRALKEARKSLRLTLSDVGAALGLANGNFVGMVERGERSPSDEKLLALAQVLKLDGRSLLAMKYKAGHPAAFNLLLQPPKPLYPRLRRLMLSTCENPAAMTEEFEQAACGLVENLVFRALLDHIILPALHADPYAPRQLRERIAEVGDAHPGQSLAAATLETQAETFIPWAKGELPMLSWRLDPLELCLYLSRGAEANQRWQLSLCRQGDELQGAAKGSAGPTGTAEGSSGAASLAETLARQGLVDDEVREILDLVEWKKARRKRSDEAE